MRPPRRRGLVRVAAVTAVLAVLAVAVVAPFAGAVTNATNRYEGPNRYDTAVDLSRHEFPLGGVPVVFVASGDAFPDALAGAPAAVKEGPGPLLLTPRASLPSSVAAEIDRLRPDRVVVLGGEHAVSREVFDALARSRPATRVAGADRYETAALASRDAFPTADTVVVATGENFPDALSGAAAGAARGWPVLLTARDALPAATIAALDAMRPRRAVVVGQPDVVSRAVEDDLRRRVSVVDRVGGDDRYGTSAAVAAYAFPAHTAAAYVATGQNHPDALAGAAAAGRRAAPLVLVPGGCIPGEVAAELDRLAPDTLYLLGGQDVVAPAVASGAPCTGPCPVPSMPLERAAAPDPRLCLAFELPRTDWLAWSRIPATFTAQNRSAQPVTVTSPTGCVVFFGRFDRTTGRHVGQGPEACVAALTTTTLAPGETRTWRWEQDTGTDDGTWVFAAGLDVSGEGVRYARERRLALSAP